MLQSRLVLSSDAEERSASIKRALKRAVVYIPTPTLGDLQKNTLHFYQLPILEGLTATTRLTAKAPGTNDP